MVTDLTPKNGFRSVCLVYDHLRRHRRRVTNVSAGVTPQADHQVDADDGFGLLLRHVALHLLGSVQSLCLGLLSATRP